MRSTLGKLRETMRPTRPGREDARQQAERAAKAIDQWLGALQGPSYASDTILKLLAQFERTAGEELVRLSWDEAAQLYLALTALHQATGDMQPSERSPGRKRFLEELRVKLAFPSGYDSPHSFDAGAVMNHLRDCHGN